MSDPLAVETLSRFFTQHRHIEHELDACEKRLNELPALAERLKMLAPLLLEHLAEKDRFYIELSALCSRRDDPSSTSMASIFETNMRVQSAALRRFCISVSGELTPVMALSFKTMASLIRNRISTEERAVFPLYARVVS